jgi:hypothetical protein
LQALIHTKRRIWQRFRFSRFLPDRTEPLV